MRVLLRRFWPDLLCLALLCLAPLLFFAPVTLGGRTLLPADNLYQYEPWASARAEQGVPEIPHNALLSDLVFQNYQWKIYLRESLVEREIPLWQANQFAGTPFLAQGQHSALYPFSLLYYVLPLSAAYGWFTVSQLALAGIGLFFYLRALGLGRMATFCGSLAYQLSSFWVVSSVHPMIQASAAWLPFLLLTVEWGTAETHPLARLAPRLGRAPYIILGGGFLGLIFLGGHVEIAYYSLLVAAFYAAFRLFAQLCQGGGAALRGILGRGLGLILLIVLGFGLGAVQFIPTLEAANNSFRTERSTLAQVRGYALPPRHVILWLMPNFYGNPAHHRYFDLFKGATRAHDWMRQNPDGTSTRVTNTDFGLKNYVEGGASLGVAALVLAGLGLFARLKVETPRHTRLLFGVLSLLALAFMFGTPLYAVLYYALPGLNQLHTPFRWVWVLTLALALFAAYGVQALMEGYPARPWALMSGGLGLLTFGTLVISRLLYGQIAGLVERVYAGLAGANLAFPDAQAFYSYQAQNVFIFSLALVLTGVALWLVPKRWRGLPLGLWLLPPLIFAESFLAVGDFNPASRPQWLDYTPPSVAWLQAKQSESLAQGEGGFRLQSFSWGEDPLIANTGWRYGLYDVRGYDSLFSKQYATFMGRIAPQTGLAFNRINPIFYDNPRALLAPEHDLLGVRYFLTDWIIRPQEEFGVVDLNEVGLTLAYEDAGLRIYENMDALPRAFTVPVESVDEDGELLGLGTAAFSPTPARFSAVQRTTLRTEATLEAEGWLILADTYQAGWRAFLRPQNAPEAAEREIPIHLIEGNFRGVRLGVGSWTVRWDYSPASFQLGAFATFISAMSALFALGVWAWGNFIAPSAEAGAAQRLAKNSLTPIVLNLFNRGIDFAFAFIMLRLLAPEGAGLYYYAIVVFGWFDILTNFGLNTLLTRDVARHRASARQILGQTTALRLILALVGLPLLAAFLGLRNTLITPALDASALFAIGLLYMGLIPNSFSTGLSAFFYAFEKAEYPAALTTVSTLIKVSLGLGALLLGWGVVGLAGASILTNLVTLVLMVALARPLWRDLPPAPFSFSPAALRPMIREAYPLMLNHLLATIFFKSDVILMEAINGASVVGVYSTAYKWLDALNIIPAFFTMALLPLMARQATEDRAALRRNYIFGFKLLVLLALPIALATTVLAPFLIGVLGGAAFLPDGGIALQLMIWSIPLGWINSLTQYVLIALNRQRRITGAFIVAVSFNIVGNLVFLPIYSYRAAAITTILSEAVLLVGFFWLLRDVLGAFVYGQALWRLYTAALGMGVVLLALWNALPLLALGASVGVYGLILLALKPLSGEEGERLARLIPARWLHYLTQQEKGA